MSKESYRQMEQGLREFMDLAVCVCPQEHNGMYNLCNGICIRIQ